MLVLWNSSEAIIFMYVWLCHDKFEWGSHVVLEQEDRIEQNDPPWQNDEHIPQKNLIRMISMLST